MRPGGGNPRRKQLYAQSMSKLRLLMVSRMAKPEEVIIVEDENGHIVRETMKDNDVLAQYKIMRETLVYLTHLDHEDTEGQMLEKLTNQARKRPEYSSETPWQFLRSALNSFRFRLHLQLNGKEYSWNTLNTLCWAVGSISGSMGEDQARRRDRPSEEARGFE